MIPISISTIVRVIRLLQVKYRLKSMRLKKECYTQ